MSISILMVLDSTGEVDGKKYYVSSGFVAPHDYVLQMVGAGASEIISTYHNIPTPAVLSSLKKTYDAASGFIGETLSTSIGFLGGVVKGVYASLESGAAFIVTTFKAVYGEDGVEFADALGEPDLSGMFYSPYPGISVYYPGPSSSVTIDIVYTHKTAEYSQFRSSFLWPFNGSFPNQYNILLHLSEFSFQDYHVNFGNRFFRGDYPYYNSNVINFNPAFVPPAWLEYYETSSVQFWGMDVQLPETPNGYVFPTDVEPDDGIVFLPFLVKKPYSRNVAAIPGAWPVTRGSFSPGLTSLKVGGEIVNFGGQPILVR